MIAVNKWDLVEDKGSNTLKHFEDKIREKTAPFTDIPILFISAINKQRIFKLLEIALEVYQSMQMKITTSKLNEVLLPIIEQTPPPAYKGKYIKIKYITQLPTKTPVFAFFCNHPKYIRQPYKNFLENTIRKKYPLTGVPIKLVFREK